MAITTTITFPVETIKTGDTLQLIMEFTHEASGSNRTWDAYDVGMRVTKWDKLEMSYDLEDALMVPATFSLEIGDAENELDKLFYGNENINVAADKQAKIIIKHNGTERFTGHIVEDTITSNPSIGQVKFIAAPKTDLINKTMVFGEGNETLWATEQGYVDTDKLKLIDELLLHIYKIANPSLTASDIEVYHDWEFKGAVVLDIVNGYFFEAVGFSLENVKQAADPIFFDNSFGISNCGDVLRKIAIDYCAFTGMLSADRPFFKKMFSYNPDNLQDVIVLSHEKGYRYGLIDYVKVTTALSDVNEPYEAPNSNAYTQLQGRFLERHIIPGFVPFPLDETINNSSSVPLFHTKSLWNFICDSGTTPPTEGSVYGNNGSQFTVASIDDLGGQWHVFTERTSGTNNPNNSTLTKVSGTGDATIIITTNANITNELYAVQVKDPIINSNAYTVIGDLTAKFWYNYRGNIQYCRVDKFLFFGVGYDFLKDFNFNDTKYQPISMKISWSQGVTECEAITIGSFYGANIIPYASSTFISDGTSYWSGYKSALSWNSTNKHMNITASETDTLVGPFKEFILTAGTTYKVTFIAKSSNCSNAFNSIGDVSALGTVISNPSLTEEWQEYEFNIVPTQTYFRIYVSAAINDVIEIDNISVREVL